MSPPSLLSFMTRRSGAHQDKELLCVLERLWLVNGGGVADGVDAAVAAEHAQLVVCQDGPAPEHSKGAAWAQHRRSVSCKQPGRTGGDPS